MFTNKLECIFSVWSYLNVIFKNDIWYQVYGKKTAAILIHFELNIQLKWLKLGIQ